MILTAGILEYTPEEAGDWQKLEVTWDLKNNPIQPHLASTSVPSGVSQAVHDVHDVLQG